MKKLLVIIFGIFVFLITSSLNAEANKWKDTVTSLTEFLQMDEYKIVEITTEDIDDKIYKFIYHIRGPKEFILCITMMDRIYSYPLWSKCYYEDY